MAKRSWGWALRWVFSVICLITTMTPGFCVDLDLGSGGHQIQATRDLLNGQSVSIRSGSATRTINVGDMITPAEFVAVQQVLKTGSQSLMVDTIGRAIGGQVSLNSLGMALNSVVIPHGVSALTTAAQQALNIQGSLVTQGNLVGLAGNSSTVTINASLINVLPTGTITTIVPQALLSAVSANKTPVNLALNSLTDVLNAGSITSSGVLRINAGGQVVNKNTFSSSVPVMAGVLGTEITSQAGQITNAGVIASATGKVALNGLDGRDLRINNTGGQILANQSIDVNGSIGKNLTEVLGGVLRANSVNVNGGDGKTKVFVDQIDGLLNLSAGEAHIDVTGGELRIGEMNLTGGPGS